MDDFDKTALQRLEEYLTVKHIPAARLEKMAGLANGYIRKNKGSLSSVKLADILSVLPDLNGDWLLTGRGKMLIEDKPKETVTVANGGTYIEQGRESKDGTFTGTGDIVKEKVTEKVSIDVEDCEEPMDMTALRKALFQARERIKRLQNDLNSVIAEKDKLDHDLNDALRTVHSLTKENQALRGVQS